MTVSVLIPTRERLEYLRHAVESVRRQSSPDWEIVVADNASSDDVRGYVESLGEQRIVYRRSDVPLPVTDNWNAALEASTGDQVIMLGDDDALMPGFLEAVAPAGDGEAPPDVVYTGAYLFAYPGVFPDSPGGYVQLYGYAEFLQGAAGPRTVSHSEAVELVADAMRFRLRFGFNMQFATLSRSLIDRLRAYGAVFQPPFPDYYAMPAALLEATRIVADPRPLVAIGVTPKSYGFYHANRREDEGMAFLEPDMAAAVPPQLRDAVMPGPRINTGWLLSMAALQAGLGAVHGLPGPDVRRYRFLQALAVYRERYLTGEASPEELRETVRHLRRPERALFAGVGASMRATQAIPPRLRGRVTALLGRRVGQFAEWQPPRVDGRFPDVLAFYDALAAGPIPELAVP